MFKLPADFAADKARCKECGGVVEVGPVEARGSAQPAARPVPAKTPAAPAPVARAPRPAAQATIARPAGAAASARAGAAAKGTAAKNRPAAAARARSRAADDDEDDDAPAGRRRGRARGSKESKKKSWVGALAAVSLLAAFLAGGWWWLQRGDTQAAAPPDGAAAEGAPSGAAADGSAPAEAAGEQAAQGLVLEDATSGVVDEAADSAAEAPTAPADADPAAPAAAEGGAAAAAAKAPANPDDIDLSVWADWERIPETTDAEWQQYQAWIADFSDPFAAARTFNAARDGLIAGSRKAMPAILNHFKALDLGSADGKRIGDQIQRELLMRICNGNNFGWKYENPDDTPEEVEVYNKKVVVLWMKAWSQAKDSDIAWSNLSKIPIETIQAGKNAEQNEVIEGLDDF